MMKVKSAALRGVAPLLTTADQFERSGKPRNAHGVPDPRPNVEALVRSVAALKEQVEILNRERGYVDDSAIRVSDYPRLRRLLLDAPTNDAQHGLVNGQWQPLGLFKPLAAAPTNPVIGMVVYANGTNWNPGSGEGLYVMKSGGWTFIA